VTADPDAAVRLVAAAAGRGWRIGVAESCTGGLVAARIVGVPGASAVFAGGVVAYEDRVKSEALGVPPELIQSHGAVSAEVAESMAEGLRDRWGLDAAGATTGIAGPAGGTADKPVGLVFIAVAAANGTTIERHLFTGDRDAVRDQAARRTVELLLAVVGGA
jgi:PncC family amidohydrolase